jgi:N-acetyl sugar amidotransferase
MKFCKECIQPNTRPTIRFTDEGVCPACVFHKDYDAIDWDERRRELCSIIEETKARNKSSYDCIIGVSGGKDSVRQAMFARDELGLRVLLVCCSYPPEQLTEVGCENLENLCSLGFDLITVSPAPLTSKKLMVNGFHKFGNYGKAPEMALYASAPKIAIAYQIPLIFLGENPAITVGALCSGSTSGDASKMKNTNTLSGGPESVSDESIVEQDLILYRYSSDEEMHMGQLRVLYLGYYIPNFWKRANAEFSIANGMKIRNDPPEDIGDITGHEALDDDFVVVNQMFKYLKLGFGKVTDQVCEEIRLGTMTREQAIELARKYDGACAPRYIERFCRYVGISRAEFDSIVESYRNEDIWTRDANGNWRLSASPDDQESL